MRAVAFIPALMLCVSCREEPPPSHQPTAAELALRRHVDQSQGLPTSTRPRAAAPARAAGSTPHGWVTSPFFPPRDHGPQESVQLSLGPSLEKREDSHEVRAVVLDTGRQPVKGAHVFIFTGNDFLARGITNERGEVILRATGDMEQWVIKAVLPGVGTAVLRPSPRDSSLEGIVEPNASAGLPRPVGCDAGAFKPFFNEFLPGFCLLQPPQDLVRLPAASLRYSQDVRDYSPAVLQFDSGRRQDGQIVRGDLGYVRRGNTQELYSASLSFEADRPIGSTLRRTVELLTQGLGTPTVDFKQHAAHDGDAECGTGTRARVSARWAFPPVDGFSSIELAANGPAGTKDLDALILDTRSFVLSLKREPAPRP